MKSATVEEWEINSDNVQNEANKRKEKMTPKKKRQLMERSKRPAEVEEVRKTKRMRPTARVSKF